MNSHDCLLFHRRIPPWILSVSRNKEMSLFLHNQNNLNASLKRHSTIKKTFEAAVRFRPTPPAFRDISRTCTSMKIFKLCVPFKQILLKKTNLLTVFCLVSLNSFKTFSLAFCASFPSNLRNSIPLLLKGISRRSKNEVHWLNTMLFSPVPDIRIFSKHFISSETFEDSFQFFTTSTRKILSVGHEMSSVFFSTVLQIGHRPQEVERQLVRRHSRHILWAQGVRMGSSADSRHIGHSLLLPSRMSWITSSMYAREGAFWETESGLLSRNLLARLSKSAYCCESARLQIFSECIRIHFQGTISKSTTNVPHN